MATQILELENSANWDVFYNWSGDAEFLPGSSTKHYGIPSLEVPLLLDSHILAVYPDSTTAKDWWITAGWISRRIRTGILVGGQPDVRATETQRLIFREICLIIYPNITTTYQLVIDIPYWFSQYSVQIWKYTGPVSDANEILITNQNLQLDRIEQKIDAL